MKHHMLSWPVAWLPVLLLCSLLGACGKPATPEVVTPLVDVFTVPVKNEQDLQKFPAVVQASDLTSLSFRVSGELTQIPVSSGQQVKKGDLIAKIDATDFELAVKDKKAKVALAKVSMQRAEKMVALKNMSQSTLDELEAKYSMAQADYEYARVLLTYVELKAPFDGIIASVPADNYQTTAPGQVVVTMHRIDKLEVKVNLPDVILALADSNNEERESITLDVSLDAYPGHVFKGRYKEHTTEQSSESKSYQLILELPRDPDRVALQGMPGSVEIDLAKLNAQNRMISVPLKAIVLPDAYPLTGGEKLLWRIKGDFSVEAIKVRAHGLADSAHIGVLGELNAGDKIAVSGLSYLKPGMKVRLVQSSAGNKEQTL
ncbi:efflux RND transporter periplasmic adaptor subunit [Thalassomonas actiniarum]|uniref:Efflux RND transporter periplasmic adaptor subunit n=1 Tax=Thalassomonas actiniarum TaxID=485447 RepID=A0AAE9YJD0_9GAMM|nr:efflux RND transporter periplasmic adaptor subunit [Thalassomonas actiniarum]WDD96691.1 efflux RND transporter periplasmic adaptor subunit [Thalassomonas actiniarum]